MASGILTALGSTATLRVDVGQGDVSLRTGTPLVQRHRQGCADRVCDRGGVPGLIGDHTSPAAMLGGARVGHDAGRMRM